MENVHEGDKTSGGLVHYFDKLPVHVDTGPFERRPLIVG